MVSVDLDDGVRRAVARVSGVRVVFLFGSRVTGKAWAESDLDVAVRWNRSMDDAARARGRLDLVDALTAELGHVGERADIVDFDRASSAVAFSAVRDGVCVFEASKHEGVRAVVDAMRRYDDDAPRRELFRRAARRAVDRLGEGTDGRR